MNKAFEKNSEVEKIKVTSAEIVVHGTSEKPYYEIRYYDISDRNYHVGYSSYDLSIVFGWLKDCFEIVNEVAEEYNNGWIKVEFHEITEQEREENHIPDTITYWLDCRLPDNEEEIICTDGKNVWVDTNWIDDGYSLDSGNDWRDIVAWQPLPEPYQQK